MSISIGSNSKPGGRRLWAPLTPVAGVSWVALMLLAMGPACNLAAPTGATYDSVTGVPLFDGGAGGPVTITIDLNQGTLPSGGVAGIGGASAMGGVGTGGTSAASATGGGTGAPVTLVPLSSAFCGDGVRDPVKEECDDGPPVTLFGASDPGDFCSDFCQVTDTLALDDGVADVPRASIGRGLGAGRHPTAASVNGFVVALVQEGPEKSTSSVRVARFDALGHRTGIIGASVDTLVQAADADPVVAMTPSGDVVVVYTDFGGDGDGKGIAARVISAAKTTAEKPQYVAQQTFGAQYAPDIIALSDRLIVAWTDAGAAVSAPDIRYRELSFDLKPLSDEKTLSAAGNVQGRVALVPLGNSWGATWRSSNGAGLETTEVYDAASGARFSVPVHLPASAEEVPALLPLDDTHRVLVFTAGVSTEEPGDAGVGDVYANELFVAGLDTAAPGTVTAIPMPVTSAYQSFTSLSRRRPALVRTQTDAYLAWWSGAGRGSVQGEDVWLERLTASIAGGALSLTLSGEQRLPRWATELGADQRFPALVIGGAVEANPGGSLFAAWEDYSGTMTGASRPEVVAQLAPLQIVRGDTLTTPCGTTATTKCSAGKGPCDTQLNNQDCQSPLVCKIGRGPQFDYGMDIAVCMAAHCANNVKDQDETGLDCGGADCGTCMCGDGVSSPLLGEVCDEGHQSATCETNCQEPTCGDSIVNPWRSEQCDDGNNVNTDDCIACAGARCGDGYLWPMHEQCELATAGCSAQCRWPSCGNGVVDTGEPCDDGNTSNTDLCVFGCRAATCGDGFIRTATEACDAGLGLCIPENCDAKYDPNCNPTTCTAPVGCTTSNSCLGAWSQMQTGLSPTETPTDARIAETFRIRNNRATGTAAVALGNIKLRYWFTKDSNQPLTAVCDAAANIGGCGNVHLATAPVSPVYRGADTVLEMTFTGGITLQPATGTGDIKLRLTKADGSNFTETGDFSFINTTTITPNPNIALYDISTGQLLWGNEPHAVPFCGDQIVDAGEQCDRGIEMADCTAVCTVSRCGDGIRNITAGEACDTSGVNTPACDSDCTAPGCGDGIVNTAAGEVCDPSVSSNCKPDCSGFVSALLCTTASSCLHVDQKVEDDPTSDDKVAPVLRLVNSDTMTDVNLDDITVRYWFSGDPADATFTPHCDYASLNNFTNQCGSVNRTVSTMAAPVTSADHVLEITFEGGVVLAKNGGSTNEIKLRVSRSTPGNFNELNDWSYVNSRNGYATGTRITIYNSAGQLIWGQEPQ